MTSRRDASPSPGPTCSRSKKPASPAVTACSSSIMSTVAMSFGEGSTAHARSVELWYQQSNCERLHLHLERRQAQQLAVGLRQLRGPALDADALPAAIQHRW